VTLFGLLIEILEISTGSETMDSTLVFAFTGVFAASFSILGVISPVVASLLGFITGIGVIPLALK